MLRRLLLVPTRWECETLGSLLAAPADVQLAVCGFGPIAAAARSVQLIERRRPSEVWLAGIAGSLQAGVEIGSALSFGAVACWGVGAGGEAQFQLPSQMGFPQLACEPGGPEEDIWERIELPRTAQRSSALLLTVCAASSSPQQAEVRRSRFPSAVCEDMEGFAVALACRLAGTPLGIVRGIANQAGDRNRSNWKMHPALLSAADQLKQLWSQP